MAKNLVTLNVENVDYSIRPYGTCSTAAATAAKTVAITDFTLCTGATVCVKFTNTNAVINPTLNVNSTGAKPIMFAGKRDLILLKDIYYEFLYDGDAWQLLDQTFQINRHYSSLSIGNATLSGLNWFTIGVVSDKNPILYQISAYAHSDVLFSVIQGWMGARVTVLNCNPGTNADYAGVRGVRLVANGTSSSYVQVLLNTPKAQSYVDIDITAIPTLGISYYNVLNDELILDSTDHTASEIYQTIQFDNFGGMYAKTFNGALKGNADTATNATNATNVNIATSNANDNYPLLFTTNVTAGNKRVYTDSANELKYNPSTSTLTTSKFVGDLAGNLTSKTLTLCGPTESDEIKIVENANNVITTNPTNAGGFSSIRKALDFRWYDSHWQIGNIRSGSSTSDGFGVTYGNDNLRFRVTTTDCFVGADKILHAGNYTNYTVTKTGAGASGTWPISISGNAAKDSDGNAINTTYLKKSGGTLTGALNFANNTWNTVGDDVYIGDCNIGGCLGVKSIYSHHNPGFQFYNSAGTALGKLEAVSTTSLKYGGRQIPLLPANTYNYIPYVDNGELKETNLRYFKYFTPDNGGRTTFTLIAKLTDWKAGTNSNYYLIGTVYGQRGGNMSRTGVYNIVAQAVSYSTTATQKLYVTDYPSQGCVMPYIVAYTKDGVTENYLALRKTGSGDNIYFQGLAGGLLPQNEWIELNVQSGADLPENMTIVVSPGVNNVYITTEKYFDGSNTRTLLHSSNYTNYVNTTNFPGLNKTGTVTSVTLNAGGGISIDNTSAITSTGTRTITNTGVRSISTGSTNGTISVNTNGTSAEVAVKGLLSAAYTDSTIYQNQKTYVNNSGEIDVYKKVTITKSSLDGFGIWIHSRQQHYLMNSGAAAMSTPYNTFWELGTSLNDKGTSRSISIKMIATKSSATVTLYILARAYTYFQVVTSGNIVITDSTSTEYDSITSSTTGWIACKPAEWDNTKVTNVDNHYKPSTSPAKTTNGLYKITIDAAGHITAATAVQKSDITDLGIPGSDTKNTAGSTNSASKMYLIGATSQGANPQTYSNSKVYATDGTLTATKFVGNLTGNADTASSVAWANVTGKPSSFTPSSHEHDYIISKDIRNTDTSPNDYGASLRTEFKLNGKNGMSDGGSYYGLLHFRPYGSATDFSGGYPHQLAFTENQNMWYRKAKSSTEWYEWKKIMMGNDATTAEIEALFA